MARHEAVRSARLQLVDGYRNLSIDTLASTRAGMQGREQYDQALLAEDCAAEKRELESWSALARSMMRSNEFFFVD